MEEEVREELVQRFDREVSDSEFGRIAGMLKVGIVIGGTTFGIAAAAFCGMAAVALVAAAVDGAGSRGPPAVAREPPAVVAAGLRGDSGRGELARRGDSGRRC